MARIAIDMDDVIADALGALIHAYNNEFGSAVTLKDIDGTGLRASLPAAHHKFIEETIHTEEFFAGLSVIEGAQEVIERLGREHEIFITTAAMEVPASLRPKFHWLQEHFPFIPKLNYIFCGHKYIVAADYLVDDQPRHFKTFTGKGILFDAPHNRNISDYPRAKTWFEVEKLIYKMESESS